jgi:hypothetical protein
MKHPANFVDVVNLAVAFDPTDVAVFKYVRVYEVTNYTHDAHGITSKHGIGKQPIIWSP